MMRTVGVCDKSYRSGSRKPRDGLGAGEIVMAAGIKVILAILVGLAASALARFSYGPSPAETYTGGFIHWLRYSGFDFGVIAGGIIWLLARSSPSRASNAAGALLWVTVVAAVLAMFGVFGK
jgi:hypothetical protein